MTNYLLRRLVQAAIVVVVVSSLIFLAMRLLPGDPILMYITEQNMEGLSAPEIEALRVKFGLDSPMAVQYVAWWADVLRGNLGESIFLGDKVTKLLRNAIPVTFHIGILSFLIGSILGMSAGTVSALRRGTYIDTTVTLLSNLGITMPSFWLAILLIYLFGLQLKLLPIFGYTSPFDGFWMSTKQIVMPVFVLAMGTMASASRQTRSSMLEVVRQDYVRTAWAKGLRERIVVFRHVIKNGLIPVITLQGITFSHILGGSVLIETVFSIPGMGKLMVNSVFNQDYQVVQGGVLVSSAAIVLTNLVVDISYGWLDPRVRYE